MIVMKNQKMNLKENYLLRKKILAVMYMTGALLTACESDFLEQKNLVKVNEEAVFTDSIYARGIVNNLYNRVSLRYNHNTFKIVRQKSIKSVE